MSDARDAFQNLQAVTGRGFDTTALYADWDEVEQRIARHRTGRVVLSSFVALAVVGGVTFAAMAMPFGGDASPAVPASATPSASASATVESSKTDQAPPDVAPTQAPAMSLFGEPYPAGVSAPSIAYLAAGDLGGRYISETDTEYIIGLLRPDPKDGHTVEVGVPFPKESVLISSATDWECAWLHEYVQATEANDANRAAAALAQVQKFPDLEVVQTYYPDIGEISRAPIAKIVAGGSMTDWSWIPGGCPRP
ncbi:hypothetical protein [Demequina lutea]|uniref:Uncharacterized protein n=1 Tax=Demequina lutea TaxID=431489 RepID=A0A7Y9ZC14_9MICO|nr:hypothetical protein [Demequina lutea]NYI42095.1 hypothetical protein [Demequina lutea]